MSIVFPGLQVDEQVKGVGLSSRRPVRLATTAAVNLAADFEAGVNFIDAVQIQVGDRILVKNQVDSTENGVYIVRPTGTVAERSEDYEVGQKVGNTTIIVNEGTINADTAWICTSDTDGVDDDEIGNVSSDIQFAKFSGDVDGPGTSTDNAIVRWDGTTGQQVQDSTILIDDSDNMTGLQYIQFSDVVAPANPADGEGRLYKKTGDDGIFWLPDSGGAEVDLTEITTVSNIGTGEGIFKQLNGADIELRSIATTANAGLSVAGDPADQISVELDIQNTITTTTVDNAADLVVIYDDDASANRAVLIQDLFTPSTITRELLQVTATNTQSTTSTTAIPMPNMALTTSLTNGEYLVYFTANLRTSTGNTVCRYVVEVGGVQQPATVRDVSSPNSNALVPVSVVYKTGTIPPGTLIRILWNVQNGNTVTVQERILIIDDF